MVPSGCRKTAGNRRILADVYQWANCFFSFPTDEAGGIMFSTFLSSLCMRGGGISVSPSTS